jgi:hypothetical protein
MGVVGADVDRLRALARTLGSAADRLENSASVVTSQLGGTRWVGPDAEHYRSQWQASSLGLIRQAVTALRDAAGAIERNAADQEQTSRAETAGLAPSGPGPSWAHILPAPVDGGDTNPLVDIRDFLKSNALWPITWDTMFATFDRSSVLSLLDALGLAADHRLDDGERLLEASGSAADLAGDLLKSVRPPVGYLAGVAVSQWGDVLTAVARADFSASTLQNAVDYITDHPVGAFEAARDAVVDYVPKLFSNLLPW